MTYNESRRRGNAKVDRKALRMAIKFSGMSQAEVARKAKVSPQQISNLLHTRQYCGADTAGKIARALNTDAAELFTLNMFGVPRTAELAA